MNDVEPLLAQQGAQAAQCAQLLERAPLELQVDGAQAGQGFSLCQQPAVARRGDRDLRLLAQDARQRHHISRVTAAVALVEIGVENLHRLAVVSGCGEASSRQLQWRFSNTSSPSRLRSERL
ncbi:hypothetical protein D3C87_1634260 [compost metagenome]